MKHIQCFKPYTRVEFLLSEANSELLDTVLSTDINLSFPKINKPVVLYGAGNLGKMAKDFFDYLKLPFLYVIDIYANERKLDKFWEDVKIVTSPSVGEKDKKKCLVIICIVNASLIYLRDKLIKEGWSNIAFFYDISQAYESCYPLNNGWFLGTLNEKEKLAIKKVFSLLTDDVSRAHYLQFLAWRKTRTELEFIGAIADIDSRFFIKEVTNVLRDNEIFVDCGAYDGIVTRKFLRLVNNKYEKIYMIEPDKINFRALRGNTKDISQVKIFQFALDNENNQKRFYSGFGFASKLSLGGNSVVETRIFDELNIPATFIKMHLEGGELEALEGSIRTLKKYRPIVAVTIYHNELGISNIPLYLMENIEDYNFYIRLHSWGGTGAVLYAVPHERIK